MAKRRTEGGTTYHVLNGISWKAGDGWANAEKGETRDIPAEFVAGFIEHGDIEPADLTGAPEAAAEEGR